jgi:aromatic ring-opening dioxygenase LigB subunit
VLLAAAVCPHPPLLIPEVAAGAAHELDDLRTACRTALAALAPHETLVVGSDAQALDIGGWLLPGAPAVIAPREGADVFGRALVEDRDVALLVMGDGSARRDEKAPGYVQPRAVPYDAAVARALATADTSALLALDPEDDETLLVAGRPAWQALAGAAGDDAFDARLLHESAPYGVGYFVAVWTRA